MKAAGEIVCDNRQLFHPDALPSDMIDLVRVIQADALRHAIAICKSRGIPMKNAGYMTALDEVSVFLEAEAARIEKGTRMSESKLDFYNGIEWFACWLLDHAEGETISEEQLRPWAQMAWREYLKQQKPNTTPSALNVAREALMEVLEWMEEIEHAHKDDAGNWLWSKSGEMIITAALLAKGGKRE